MAPWPDQENEPKAPDKEKSESASVVGTSRVESEEEQLTAIKHDQKADEKEVLTLDEGQLKALLDEAITYKNPKDREGKSELFKELLQEAEADESESKGLGNSLGAKFPRGYYNNLPARRRQSRHGGQSREGGVGVSSTRGGSLQNLHALGMEGGRRSRKRDTLVSARQREGGSLPTNVNVDNDPDLDMICPNYTSRATLEVSSHTKEDDVSREETSVPTFLKSQGLGHLPNGTDTKEDEIKTAETMYASSISVGPVESGAMLYPSTPVQHVSVLSIPPSQIHTGTDDHRISDSLEAKKLNVSRSRQHKKSQSSEETENASEGLLGLPLTATAHWSSRYSSFTLLDFQDTNTRLAFGNVTDGKTKPLDENGNALACVRMDSNCLDRKKQRRVKAKNDRNTILSDEIEGFRGGADIDTLMEYIESPSLDSKSSKARTNQPNGTRNSVKVRSKEEEPKSFRRRKERLQRCNSLEEISRTKLEDLTEEGSSERVNGPIHPPTKKQITLDDTELGIKSSWDQAKETSIVTETKDRKPERTTPEPVQESEFHVVTKKQRKKKRRTGCGSRAGTKQDYYSGREGGSNRLMYQYRRDQGSSQPRRKSASSVPPSDKSDSSDLDSVHSLPVSSSARTRAGQNSVSGGSTPQASYADIAKSAASPPDGSQVNIYKQDKCSPSTSFSENCETNSTNPISMLPVPLASCKKDVMTDNCDNSPITKEDYPPLEVRPLDFCIDTNKRSRSVVTTDKVNVKTDSVIQSIGSGDGPRSLPNDILCVKSSDYSNKRPPVILMNDPTRGDSRVPEIQFGFAVNYQLLENEDDCSQPVDTPPQTPAEPTPAPDANDLWYWYSQFTPDPEVAKFLSTAWEKIEEKLRAGEALYYNGQ